MDTCAFHESHKALRERLFRHPSTALVERAHRDLAAHMLMYLDEVNACWQIAAEWLRQKLDADRVDGGRCISFQYTPMAEACRPARNVPSMLNTSFDLNWPGVQLVLQVPQPVHIRSVKENSALGAHLQRVLLEQRTASKLAMRVQAGQEPIGIICVDWLDDEASLDPHLVSTLERAVVHVMNPVLAEATSLNDANSLRALQRRLNIDERTLTPAEWKVAQLVGMGLSYKEIARELGRSVSTVDHQLRSMRQKLDVTSTSKLVSLLSNPLQHPVQH